MTSRSGDAIVDFLVVGAQKAGTTSIHRYLQRHPELYLPPGKEIGYFASDKSHTRGLDYYRSFFEGARPGAVVGEVSPQYMYFSGTPKRIAAHNADCRLIMLVRHPIERALSHYKMNLRRGIEDRSFGAVMREYIDREGHAGTRQLDPEMDYFGLGEYGRIVAEYYQSFPQEQLLIEYAEDLQAQRMAVLDRVQDHLGVERRLSPEDVDREFHVAGESRFKGLYSLQQQGRRLPPGLKKSILKVLGRDRVHTILHKLDTDWNVASSEVKVEVDPDLRFEVAQRLAPDYLALLTVSGLESRWVDLT